MKHALLLSALLGLAACSSSPKPDPRAAQIHALHEQLLSKQQVLAEQAKNPALVANGGNSDAQRIFTNIVQESQANLTTLDQFQANKAADPAQIVLTGELLTKENELLETASAILARNQDYIERTAKSAATK